MTTTKLNPLTNFFATHEELATWITDWVQRFHLDCVLGKHPPTDISRISSWDNLEKTIQILFEYTSAYFLTTPIDTRFSNLNHIWERNPGLFSIDFPPETTSGLGIGCLGTGTKDFKNLQVWKKIAADFDQLTIGGMWGVFPSEAAPQFEPSYRYSGGAAELWRKGDTLHGFGADTWHIECPSKIAKGGKVD